MSFDDDLKKRMALARQQGWDDQTIQRSALIERGIYNQNQQKQAQQKAATAKAKQPSGAKKFWVNAGAIAASTVAGIGGIAAAPLTGGASLVGAGAAGAGIEALRRKMLGEEQNAGASLFEGALTALPGSGVFKAGVKGAKTAVEAAKVAGTAERIATKTVPDATRQAAAVVPKRATTATVDKPFTPATAFGHSTGTAEDATDSFKAAFKPKGTGILDKSGTNMRGNSRGIYPGAKVGSSELGVEEARNLNKAVDAALTARPSTDGATATIKSLRPKSAVSELEQIEQHRAELGRQIREAIGKDNVVMDANRKTQLGQRVQEQLGNVADFDMNNPAHLTAANNMLKQLDVGDLAALEAGRKNIDQVAKSAFKESDSTTQFKARIAEALRQATDHFVTDISPASKKIKTQYHNLTKATDYMKRAGTEGVKPFGMSGGVIPTLSARGPVGKTYQAVEDGAGRTLQGADKVLHTPAFKRGAINYGGNALATGGITAPLTRGPAPIEEPQIDPNNPYGLDPNDPNSLPVSAMIQSGVTDFDQLAAGLGNLTAQGQGDPNAPQDPASQQVTSDQLFQAAMEAFQAGDTKSSDQYLQLAQFAAAKEKAGAASASGGAGGGDGLNITKVTAQQYGLAQSGAGALSQITEMIQKDPGVLTRTATPGRGLPIVGGFISNAAGTGSFDAIGYNIADSILRLRTGAQANESEVKKLQSQIMPRAGDSAETVQTKLAQIQQIFDGVLKTAGNASATDPTVQDFGNFSSIFNTQGAY